MTPLTIPAFCGTSPIGNMFWPIVVLAYDRFVYKHSGKKPDDLLGCSEVAWSCGDDDRFPAPVTAIVTGGVTRYRVDARQFLLSLLMPPGEPDLVVRQSVSVQNVMRYMDVFTDGIRSTPEFLGLVAAVALPLSVMEFSTSLGAGQKYFDDLMLQTFFTVRCITMSQPGLESCRMAEMAPGATRADLYNLASLCAAGAPNPADAAERVCTDNSVWSKLGDPLKTFVIGVQHGEPWQRLYDEWKRFDSSAMTVGVSVCMMHTAAAFLSTGALRSPFGPVFIEKEMDRVLLNSRKLT